MRVLSLFDGMSCGQIALREIGITPEVYYASEVDKVAIAQTIPEWYRWECSDASIMSLTGNGWTVEIIKHIFTFIKC